MINLYHLPGLSRLDNFAMTRKLSSGYRDYAKNHSSRLATYFTAGPLCCNNILSPSTRLPQVRFASLPGQIDNTLTNSFRVTNPFYLDCRKPALPSASLFCFGDKFVPPGQTLKLYFTRLAPLACIWQFTVLFLKKIQNRLMSAICKLACAPASLSSLSACRDR
jgi:hypothetical protein